MQFWVVSFMAEPEIPMAVYIQRARGGVMPSIAPQITGSRPATRKGLAPAAAMTETMAVPKMATWEEPGSIMPRTAVNKGMIRARGTSPSPHPDIMAPMLAPTLRDSNRLLMQ